MAPAWSVFPSRIRSRSETRSFAQDGVSATSPCSGQRIDGSRAVTNASNAITSGWRQVPSVNSTAWQARPQCGHGNREPARQPRRRSTRRRSKSKSLLTTRHGGSSCKASGLHLGLHAGRESAATTGDCVARSWCAWRLLMQRRAPPPRLRGVTPLASRGNTSSRPLCS